MRETLYLINVLFKIAWNLLITSLESPMKIQFIQLYNMALRFFRWISRLWDCLFDSGSHSETTWSWSLTKLLGQSHAVTNIKWNSNKNKIMKSCSVNKSIKTSSHW